MKIFRLNLGLVILGLSAIFACAHASSLLDQPTIAQQLGWHSDHSPHACNVCNGYYKEPRAIATIKNPPNYKKTPITITANGQVTFQMDGVSVLHDDVIIRQPGRIVHADKAFLYRNNKTGKITDIKLVGHVTAQEEGKLLVGTHADYDIANNAITINDALYRIVGKHESLSETTTFNAWGTATTVHRDANGIMDLTHAQYSTCPPIDPSWVMSASKMHLDYTTEEGYAKNTVIRFKNVPILYMPYYSFPLSDARKSGFLPPSYGYGTQHGLYLSAPYYWNIAPNYDLLITPQWYAKNGFQLTNLFRYLTPASDGFLYASFLPNDTGFANYQQSTLNSYANSPISITLAPYIAQLQNAHTLRGFVDFENHFEFNPQWSAKLYARYVSDPYYAETFQSEYLAQSTNQIPSFGELDYQGTHWTDNFLVQSYQTLHPIDQYLTPTQNQYTRLPEMNFSASYPGIIDGTNFNLSSQLVHFDYQSAFNPATYQMPIGDRIHLQPSFSRPFNWASFYITPQITADSTSYFAELPSTTSLTPRPNFDVNRTLPILNIDSGFYFDRDATIGGHQYIQTFEPRLFYLYTPYENQSLYPNFDTQLLPFSIENLYTLNQFSGFDRLQNANQISIGLTSNWLRASDASDILSAQIGLIDYFTPPQVYLLNPPTSTSISPIAGSLTWNPNAVLSFNSQAAWDTMANQLNNAQFSTEYHISTHRIVILGYQFAHGNSDTPFDQFGFSTNSSLLTAGLVWPLTDRWRFFGYSYYDLIHTRPQNQYVGLSYSTCCWALRVIVADNYIGTLALNNNQTLQNQYSSAYYMEFLLKGLGGAGNRRAEDMLTSTLPGFSDMFSDRSHYDYNQSL